MDRARLEQVIEAVFVGQPCARAAAMSEVVAAYSLNTLPIIKEIFGRPENSAEAALLELAIRRGRLWVSGDFVSKEHRCPANTSQPRGIG